MSFPVYTLSRVIPCKIQAKQICGSLGIEGGRTDGRVSAQLFYPCGLSYSRGSLIWETRVRERTGSKELVVCVGFSVQLWADIWGGGGQWHLEAYCTFGTVRSVAIKIKDMYLMKNWLCEVLHCPNKTDFCVRACCASRLHNQRNSN